MEWNVYYCDVNHQEIKNFNIFKHYNFLKYVKQAIRKCQDKDEFSKRLKSELFYYYGSKCEWELIIEITEDNRIFLSPWVGCRNPEEVRIDVTNDTSFDWRAFAEEHISKQIYKNEAKIDVYDQVMMNWNVFVDYVLDNKKEILKIE